METAEVTLTDPGERTDIFPILKDINPYGLHLNRENRLHGRTALFYHLNIFPFSHLYWRTFPKAG